MLNNILTWVKTDWKLSIIIVGAALAWFFIGFKVMVASALAGVVGYYLGKLTK